MSAGASNSKPGILYIEDDLSSMDIVRKIVTSFDCEFVWAGMGIEGVAKARTNKPDLVFVDIELHDIDGYEVIKSIRETYASLPIIAITSHDIQEVCRNVLQAGGNEVLQKPAQFETLKTVIHKYIPKLNEELLKE